MRLTTTVLRSRVAQRIFLLFVLCALLPIAVLAVVSFFKVASEIEEQNRQRLRQASKAYAMSLYERLTFVEADLQRIGSMLEREAIAAARIDENLRQVLSQRIESVFLLTPPAAPRPLLGRLDEWPELGSAELQHLASAKAVLLSRHGSEMPSAVFMALAVRPDELDRGILLARIDGDYLWWGPGKRNSLPALIEICILGPSQELLFHSMEGEPRLVGDLLRHGSRGRFEWEDGDTLYVAGFWQVPLRFSFLTPSWTIVMSQPKAEALRPLTSFRHSFLLVVLVSLWVVLLLSIAHIRRSLVPLDRLKRGTRQIAEQRFETRVDIHSGDEFQELAASFNKMAERLGKQFSALQTTKEIVRAILSALDTESIMNTVVGMLPQVVPCDRVSVTLIEAAGSPKGQTWERTARPGGELASREVALPRPLLASFPRGAEIVQLDAAEGLPVYLDGWPELGVRAVALAGIFVGDELDGVIAVGFRQVSDLGAEDASQLRQVADQVAVALANASLVEELRQLSWGTLTALARAIDANSPWTMGHSERVTELAKKIGAAMNLSEVDLETLHRGGLLHDIGKVGVPTEVLNKPGKLTETERRLVEDHVVLGARILEPIPGFEKLIPIVRQHHEWYNGGGYPDRLAGEEISLLARIFAVADCYDAIASKRPYHPARTREEALGVIVAASGRQFDPQVVEAFVRVMKEEEEEAAATPAAVSLGDTKTG